LLLAPAGHGRSKRLHYQNATTSGGILLSLKGTSPFPLHFVYTMTLGRGSRNQKSAGAVFFF